MADFPGQGYPSHVPPQHAPRLQQRKRKQKPPASLSKLHRPLVSYKQQIRNTNPSSPHKKKMKKNTNPKTRFYCNDCKKKFRSRILANRNNNAVQHYCSLYAKIITRKVEAHSNKCKGDHGMGPCVVRRTDTDPDSDGEDETKAAYYADRGKKRPASARKSGAYTKPKTKKRKRENSEEECDTNGNGKRHRRNHNDVIQQPIIQQTASLPSVHYPPMTGFNGYYHENGYVQSQHGYNGQYGAYPPITNPPMLYSNSNGNNYHNHNRAADMPPPPIMEPTHSTGCSPPAVIVSDDVDNMVGPPPALEAFEAIPMEIEQNEHGNESNNNEIGDVDNGNNKEVAMEETSKGNGIGIEVVNSSVVEVEEGIDDDVECINDENTEDEDDLPDLTVPCNSPSPTTKNNKNGSNNNDENKETEDDDLLLVAPL